jgi:hypothetical protein
MRALKRSVTSDEVSTDFEYRPPANQKPRTLPTSTTTIDDEPDYITPIRITGTYHLPADHMHQADGSISTINDYEEIDEIDELLNAIKADTKGVSPNHQSDTQEENQQYIDSLAKYLEDFAGDLTNINLDDLQSPTILTTSPPSANSTMASTSAQTPPTPPPPATSHELRPLVTALLLQPNLWAGRYMKNCDPTGKIKKLFRPVFRADRRPMTFSGNSVGSISPVTYIRQLELIKEQKQLSTDEMHILFLENLTGHARAWTQQTQMTRLYTWPERRTAFLRHFALESIVQHLVSIGTHKHQLEFLISKIIPAPEASFSRPTSPGEPPSTIQDIVDSRHQTTIIDLTQIVADEDIAISPNQILYALNTILQQQASLKQNLHELHTAILTVQKTLSNVATATLPPPLPPKPEPKSEQPQRFHTRASHQQETRIAFIPPRKAKIDFPQYEPISP